MKQEDKELLLKDLCARLPYGVKVQVPQRVSINPLRVYAIEQVYKSTFYCERNGWVCKFWNETFARIDEVKPYLRPMSSMTEEEKCKLAGMCLFYECYSDTDSYSHYGIEIISQYCVDDKLFPENIVSCEAIDWLNSYHFDYRGLIPKRLALEAPKGMYD